MRILFVAWRDLANPDAGGSEVVVDALARGLQSHGHEVALMCAGPIAPRSYEVVANGGRWSQYALAPVRFFRRFRDVDLVVDVSNGVPFFSPLWCRRPRVCLVHHVHANQWWQYFPGPVAATADFLERRVVPLVYRGTPFVAVSPSTARDLEATGIDAAAVHVVCNGVDAPPGDDTKETLRASEPLFVALGRIAPNKRIERLLDLWRRVQPTVGGQLVLIGDGPDRDRIQRRIDREPELATVRMEGRVSEARKHELLGEAWAIVHASEREGWGLVLLEAGLRCTPALAYRVPGVVDAVVDGVTGLLAENDEQFVDNWCTLAADASLRRQLGAAARTRALEFGWDRSVDEFQKVADVAVRGYQHRRSGTRGARP